MPSKTHTPGPWYRGELPCSGDAHGNPPTVYIWDESETTFIATVCDEDNNGHATDANANLIAAAPEMFDALTAFVESFSSNGEFNNRTAEHSIPQLHAMAKSAIRKAKGK